MKFEELNLPEQVLKGVKEIGFDTPTEVQEKCIPLVMAGKDIIVQSKTGSGKTAGFGLPLLSKCDSKSLEAVILVPTRELAVQVCKEIEILGKHSRVKPIPIYGGASINNQIRDLPGKSVVVATPGRFIDIFKQGYLKLDRVKYVVLDEADRMLDMGFEPDIRFIMSHLPKEKQTLLFSATMPEPIQRIAHRYMSHPEMLLISKDEVNVDSIVQTYYGTNDQKKLETLGYILDVEKPHLAIVFCNTKRGADFVERSLKMSGYNAVAIHGDLTQSKRERVIQDFKDKNIHILVASDVAARGLHVDDISHVINYDLPDDPDVYVHRIGRTGRVGKAGKAISIVTMSESRTFDMIRRRIRKDPARETIDPEKFRHHIIIPQRSQRGRGFGDRPGFRGGPRRGFNRGPRREGSGDRDPRRSFGGPRRGGGFNRGPRRRF